MKTNRLIHESSPYLLQHARNPVDWYPWGDEAFEKARREGKPILLSIGYSTCHWCHVMERESFEDPEIADFLNRHYVAVKVDREERPDVDAVHMAAVQLFAGAGGWPMTLWLTPERKPFYAGTYFPAHDGERGCRLGFLTLLERLSRMFETEREEVVRRAAAFVAELEKSVALPESDSWLGPQAIGEAYARLESGYDAGQGGFGLAPKFPRPVALEFLLRYGARVRKQEATEMALHTLRKMACGGIFDQIGGGFHRYSVDRYWRVPHFEKMLYDNAQLALVYLKALQVARDPLFERVARETLDYLTREMADARGGFYAATDADSEGVEGKFFAWGHREILAALGETEGALVAEYFGASPEGNFEGGNVLHVPVPPEVFAKKIGRPFSEVEALVRKGKGELRALRSGRIPPPTDDKILTGWNGLAIAAFSRAGWQLAEPRYLAAAGRAAAFCLEGSEGEKGLPRGWRNGKPFGKGFLDDYAFLVFGLLELFEATGRARWLKEARRLQSLQERRFRDGAAGGYFTTEQGRERLLFREKPYYDGAEPSGNSVAALNLLRLSALLEEAELRTRAGETLAALSGAVGERPEAAPLLLCAADAWRAPWKEIALVGKAPLAEHPLMEPLRSTFLPDRVVVIAEEGKDRKELEEMVPWLRERVALGGSATAYVCENRVCKAPASAPAQLRRQLAGDAGA